MAKGGRARDLSKEFDILVDEESSELDLINRIVDIVRQQDPDILTGYEVHGGSWGYLIERARCKYEFNLCDELSRMKSQSRGRFGKDQDRWGFNTTSTISITGRHMINIWRAMRGELNLLQYTLENVAFHLLHRRIPHYSFKDLTVWFTSGRPRDLSKVLRYYISRVHVNLEILEKNELIPRTSEQARILGVEFFAVFSRGSQFKVESLMFRIAKTEGYMLISPSRKQVGQQNALECLPLVMEPQSDFYNSPVLVLDFQSLYPSIMIAYNYCYSTFLGRVVDWRGQNKMGFTDYKREPRLLELLGEDINISPNGMLYVKPNIRKSLLAKMLGEILETRVMVKSGMKINKEDKALQQLLNNRQLALKLIANVTYGYTSASFSGRMPCSEIADSIVQTGRETLERAIAYIHSVDRWGAEVVYGDTDSLFVHLKGRSKDEAFDIGEEIAESITRMNPKPMKLKFEKVYLPSVLLAKKRYVGFKYESRHQETPVFDAKGIETVRRDGTPAEQKIEETVLKTLFRTADLSQVKEYFQAQCSKIMQGKVSIQDFCFAREVRLGTYSDKGPGPPGALISSKKMLQDPRAEPQYGERVPYVVVAGAPGARLVDRCVAPEELLQNEHLELDAEYYITKNLIPPLERIFNLVGANVRAWYDEVPKIQRHRRVEAREFSEGKTAVVAKRTLESYLKSTHCVVCRNKAESSGPVS
ncbi:MAG: DNA polymerase zeta [Phylliscum demangeonii]|nr:MAG: DNA polymerase zeta [Phylliscum demangeonii]